MTSIAFVSSSPEQKKRLVNITTTIKAADWAEIVKRIAGCRDVVDFELFRYTKYVRTGYSLSVLVESADETDDECVVRILGQPFVDKFLPVSDKKTVAQINPEFHRIMTAGKMDVEDEFLIYETISEAKNIHKSHETCLEDYKTESQNFENAIAPEAAKTFNKLAKKNHLEGGSWLCLPKLKRGEFSDSESTERNLRRILEKLCMEFCSGRLQAPYISKISYSKLKSVVKVSNDKTIYFDYMENNIGKDLGTEESLFRSDREVRMIFRHLVDMRLGAQFRYKPEIFTACKLNTKNAGMRLSLYNEMRFERKLAIAMEQ